jgi:hypothetical protein
MDFNLWLGTVSTVGTLSGLLFGWSQAIKARDLRRRINADIWKLIASAQAVRAELESSEPFKQCNAQVRGVWGKIIEQYRDLLKTAILDEPRFTEETIQKWLSSGRLMNDWEASQARKHIGTAHITYRVSAKGVGTV